MTKEFTIRECLKSYDSNRGNIEELLGKAYDEGYKEGKRIQRASNILDDMNEYQRELRRWDLK